MPLRIAFVILALATLYPSVTSAMALLAGVAFALVFGNPFAAGTKRWAPVLLQASIVGLGAGMDLAIVGRVGIAGIGYTAVGIALTLIAGRALGRLFGTDRETSVLLGVGTAICGGSAIAAVAPVIRARSESISVSLAVVFLLNASALLFFPSLGHWAGLDQRQFGLFSALAVHDTSSVVGTALQYGAGALAVATPVKLARALWIFPVVLLVAWAHSRGASAQKPKAPWFILGFLFMAALVTYVPPFEGPGELVAEGARRVLVLTLFLIGAGLSRATLKAVGPRPLLQGLTLWALVGGATLTAIRAGWIR